MVSPSQTSVVSFGAAAALAWCLLCLRWFDDGAPLQPHWLSSLPPWPFALLTLVFFFLWFRRRASTFWGDPGDLGGLGLVFGLAILFRLPLAVHGAAGYTTPDGALSGVVALHLLKGSAHHVFIPQLPYSGSLKSHIAVLIAALTDLPRAFTLASVLFYGAFVAGVYRLGGLVGGARTALFAGLYLAFSPAYVTHYSLSNDGNYVEVLCFGTWALFLAARWATEPERRETLALLTGILLGLGLWCHLLAIIYAAAILLWLLLFGRLRSLVGLLWLSFGCALGYFPGLLWNLGHGWESLNYLIPGVHTMRSVAEGPGVLTRALLMGTEQLPILFGYEPGYEPPFDLLLMIVGVLSSSLLLVAALRALRGARLSSAIAGILTLAFVNLLVAVVFLPRVPSNPRYILFLMTPAPILLAELLGRGAGRFLLAFLIALGCLLSLAQAPHKFEEDAKWRKFVKDLQAENMRYCFTDFYLAIKIDFLSGEAVTCCSKLGPTFTEYFFEYRREVEEASEAGLVAVNETAAEKLGRRLERLGVAYTRKDLLKPTFFPSRKVDPSELFPDKSFPLR